MQRKIATIIALYLTTLLLMALQKPLFMLWYAERIGEAATAELTSVIWHGLLLDSTIAGYICALPWLMMLISVWAPLPQRIAERVLKAYFAIIAFISAIIVAVDMGLFGHWDFRIDSTIFPYLLTPKEAAASLTWGDIWPSTLLFVIYGALLYICWRPISRLYRQSCESVVQRLRSTLVMVFMGGLLFLAIRGGVDTAPANVSKVYFSDNMLLNQAATNPIFSLMSSAAREELNADDYRYFSDEQCAEIYAKMQTRSESSMDGAVKEPALATSLLKSTQPNVVLIMLESIGRTVMDEQIDGKAVAPNLQRLKNEGIWFENVIANSFRTDRGTVAVMSGFAAHPVVSVMKFPQKAHTLPAIARTLKQQGYRTSFTYGGDANFTNTISYLYGTGVERITDKAEMHFDAPLSSWGYDDNVVCPYFAEQVLQLAAEPQPFFATLLTLSSHEPFDVPATHFENKILNSVAFTDEYVGAMIERWRNSEAWDNMLVILIADHGMPYPEGVATGDLTRQRIPMIWCGGALATGGLQVNTFASQADMAATLLAQMGLPHDDFTYSRNIFDPEIAHFGFWSYNNAFGMIDQSGHIVYDCHLDSLSQSEGSAEDVERLTMQAKAMMQTLHQDIRNR